MFRVHRVEFADFVGSFFQGNVTKFASHKALQLIARGNLSFFKGAVLHRVVTVQGLDWVQVLWLRV